MSKTSSAYSFDPFDAEALKQARDRQRRRMRFIPDDWLVKSLTDEAQRRVPRDAMGDAGADADDLLVLEARLRTWADALDAGQVARVLDSWQEEKEAELWAKLVGQLGGTWDLQEVDSEWKRERLFRSAVEEAEVAKRLTDNTYVDDDEVKRDLLRLIVVFSWAGELGRSADVPSSPPASRLKE